MLALWGWEAETWSALAASVAALAAVLTLGVAVVAARYARGQVEQARATREEQSQPYVVVSMQASGAGPDSLDLVVENLGQTAAHDVRLAFTPALQQTARGGVEALRVPTGFPVLVPRQSWRTFWDEVSSRYDEEWREEAAEPLAERHEVVVAFRDSRGRELGPLRFVLDWGLERDRGYLVLSTPHDAAEALQGIHKTLKGWGERPGGGGGLRVLARDGDRRDRRARTARQERKRVQAGGRPGRLWRLLGHLRRPR